MRTREVKISNIDENMYSQVSQEKLSLTLLQLQYAGRFRLLPRPAFHKAAIWDH